MAAGTSGHDLQKAAQATKEQARNMMNDAAESAKSSVTQRKDSAAESLGSFAGALRRAASEGDGGQATGMAEWAADGLERVSSTLRNKDLDGMLRDVQSFARQQPAAFFFGAMAAGFLATRFLKAGAAGQADPAHEAKPQNFPPPDTPVAATDVGDISSATRV